MWKQKYATTNEDIPICRGLLHGIFAPVFFMLTDRWWEWPHYTLLIGLSYLVSFIFHRIGYREEVFRQLDYGLILWRVVLFGRWRWTGVYLMLGPWILSQIQPGMDMYRLIRIYLIWVIALMVVIHWEYEIVGNLIYTVLYLPPGLIYALEPAMWWHRDGIWGFHEDFHLGILIADLIFYWFL